VTARPDVIGAGFRRAGRFDNTVAIEMPGPEARLSMLQRLAKGKAVPSLNMLGFWIYLGAWLRSPCTVLDSFDP
jgi:SpoVK/Ycf46/Vps4 family AAA+-type ATPase